MNKNTRKNANTNNKKPAIDADNTMKEAGVVTMEDIQQEPTAQPVDAPVEQKEQLPASRIVDNQEAQESLNGMTDSNAVEVLQAQLQAARQALESQDQTIKQQQGLLLGEARAQNAVSPYQYALSAEEIPFVQQHNDLRDKHVKVGLTHNEMHDWFSVRMKIDGIRGLSHEVKRGSLLKGDQPVAKEFGQRRKLHIDDLPGGWHHYMPSDSNELCGKEINEALAKGYRFVNQDGSFALETAGEVFSPDFVGNLITQHVGIDKTGSPVTAYLMAEPQESYEERNRQTTIRRDEKQRAAIEEFHNEFSQQAKSGENTNMYGNVSISRQV